jgi:TIR domain
MAKIFISYSQVDKKIVEELVRDLGADNHDIWFDRKLRGGQKWWDNILSQIKACEIFVAALSPEYVESRPCQSEREYANRLERILLPVLLSDKVVQNSLPQDLIGVQWVDYSRFDKQGLLDLQAALRNLPKAPRLPKLLPAAPSIPIDPREPIPKPQPPPIVPEKLEEPSRWGDSKKHVPPVKEKSTEDDTVYGRR